MNLLEDLDRIVETAQNGDPLTRLEILALADAYETQKRRAEALAAALDTAQTMIDVRVSSTGITQPLALAKAA